MADELDLPADVRAAIDEANAKTAARLADFAAYVAERRDEAVAARKASGIEDEWTKAEEAYLGIDDLNRHEWVGAKWASWIKGPTPDSPIRQRTGPDDDGRATAFVRLTSRYVDAGAAKIAEIMIPIDGKTFTLQPTPVPEVVEGLKDDTPVNIGGEQPMADPEPTPEGMPEGPPEPPRPLTVKDLAAAVQKKADAAAEMATDYIHDWMVECRHTRSLRKAIFDGARLGTMIVKGPLPTRTQAMALKTEAGITVEMIDKMVPTTEWVNPWRFYPDPSCGEDIHKGSFVCESDELSPRALAELKRQPGYMGWAIDQVIAEGPEKCYEQDNGKANHKHRPFTVWYFWGSIDKQALAMCNPRLYDKRKDKLKGREVYAIVTMVNDTPIKVSLNPLQSGRFPHKVATWRRRSGHWAGVGVAEQIKTPQAIVTGAWRAMMNNAGKSAGSQIVMDNEAIIPADGKWTITPDKMWHKAPGQSIQDVRAAFTVHVIPNVTPQLLTIIDGGMRLAEESTSIPLITQGQSGDTTPDTFGATQLQNNNANQLLRDVGAGIAEDITEPLVRDFYEWLLLDPNVPDDAKGDFQVDVSGSLALIEKAVQDQTIMQMGALVANPAFGLDPELWIAEYLRSKRLNPANFALSDEKKRAMAKQPPPVAPQVEAAKIRAEAQVAVAQSRDELTAKKIEVDTDRDVAYVQSQQRRDAATYDAKIKQLELEERIADLKYRQAMLDYANKREMGLEQIKAELAEKAMELRTQRELAGLDDSNGVNAKQVSSTDMEPVGRADDGRAFEQ